MFDVHQYGAVTELRCAAELIKRGWNVAFPFINQSAVDLIAHKDDQFVTIQIKSSRHIIGGYARVVKNFDKYDGVDFIICYDIYNRRWFVFPFEILKGKKQVTLSPNKYKRFCDNWDLIR